MVARGPSEVQLHAGIEVLHALETEVGPQVGHAVPAGAVVEVQVCAPEGFEVRRIGLRHGPLPLLQQDGAHERAGVPAEPEPHGGQRRGGTRMAPPADHGQMPAVDHQVGLGVAVLGCHLGGDPDARRHLLPPLYGADPRPLPVLVRKPGGGRQQPPPPGVQPRRCQYVERGLPGLQQAVDRPAVVRMGLGHHQEVYRRGVDLQVLHVVHQVPVPEPGVEEDPPPLRLDEDREALGAYEGRVHNRAFVVDA